MKALRTPGDRFSGLEFADRFGQVDVSDGDGGTLRVGFAESGPPDAVETVLLLHGEPTWSYLYRMVMRVLADAGHRCVAVDLVGFGRSDKPSEVSDHSYARHVEWVREAVFDRLDLRDLTLVGQDWGGLIGLRLVAEHPDRFSRVVAANTGLPTGDRPMPKVWWAFRSAVEQSPDMAVSDFVAAGCKYGLSDADKAAYDAPFPDPSYKAGPRALPLLVPTSPDDPASVANRRAWDALARWDKPFLVAFSDGDPITGAMAPILRSHVPTASAEPQVTIRNAAHFLQEDAGDYLAREVADFITRNPR